MSYQSGDILFLESDGFVNDILTIIQECTVHNYKGYTVHSREQDCTLNYSESYLKVMTISGEDYKKKYGIKKQDS